MPDIALIEQLRSELPRLLREHPEVRHEVWGIMLEAFPSRQEFMALLEETRIFREESNRRFEESREESNRRFEESREESNRRFEESREESNRRFEELRTDMNRRFEAVDHRFEAVDHRFEEVIATLHDHGRQLRDLNVHMSSLGGRVGHGLEQMVKAIVEEFAGQAFPSAERLVLRDEAGEVYGVPGAEVEFDLYVHNGTAYVVEVKSHLKTTDVMIFYRKVQFAEGKLSRSFIPLVIALSVDAKVERRMRELGVRYRVGIGEELRAG